MLRKSTFFMMMVSLFVAMAFFLATAAAVIADGAPLGDQPTGKEEMTTAALKMLGSLILVIGLIVTLFYLARKVRGRVAGPGRTARMQLIETLTIAPRRLVVLVEIRDQWLILGVGTEEVRLLSQLQRPVENEAVERHSGAHDGFQSILKRNMIKGWISGSPKGGRHDPA
jgi:flagellar biosynthetic protein FliO